MPAADEVTWLVGRAEEVGELQERLASVDATVEETWPAGVNAGVVALVCSAAADADAVAEALGHETQRFEGQDEARHAATALAAASGE